MSDGVSNGDAPSKTTNGGGGGAPPPRDEEQLQPVDGKVNPPTQPPANRPGRVTNQLQFLKNNVMKAMWKHQYGWPFHNPVDTIQFGLKDYFKIVKKPMDLGKHKYLNWAKKNRSIHGPYYFLQVASKSGWTIIITGVLKSVSTTSARCLTIVTCTTSRERTSQ